MTHTEPEIELKTVVYGTDFSVSSQNAGFYAAFLAKHFSARLLVAHAFILSQAAMEVESDRLRVSQQRKHLEALLATTALELASKFAEAVPVLLDGSPKQMLPVLADDHDHAPSMIVLGTHGGGWIEHELIGSVAEQILRSTSWPCLTVGPRVPRGSEPFIHRILYVTDFTSAAARAAVYAFSFAESFAAGVDVFNVIPPDTAGKADKPDVTIQFREALEKLVPDWAKKCCDPHTFVEIGEAHRKVLQHIQERSIDLLVLGIRKTSHLGLEMRTSQAFRLIVDAPCPVLTVTG